MEFTSKGKNPKTKKSTLCNDYENGGLKHVDIFSKVLLDVFSEVLKNALG